MELAYFLLDWATVIIQDLATYSFEFNRFMIFKQEFVMLFTIGYGSVTSFIKRNPTTDCISTFVTPISSVTTSTVQFFDFQLCLIQSNYEVTSIQLQFL